MRRSDIETLNRKVGHNLQGDYEICKHNYFIQPNNGIQITLVKESTYLNVFLNVKRFITKKIN